MSYRGLLVVMLILAEPVFGQEDCTKLTDHNLTIQCLKKENQTLTHQLRDADDNLLRKLRQAEQTLPERYRGKLVKRYKAAYKAWEKFRETQCEYERMHALGGIEEPIVNFQCLNQLNKEYIEDLQEQIKAWTYE